MIKNPKNHRRQKYENLPITITERLSYRGVSTIYHSTHELNYSPVATSHVIRILDCLPQLPRFNSNTVVATQESLQTGDKTSCRVPKRETTEIKKAKYPYTPTSLEPPINVGAL